jgi:L-ribulose-5-phosphate 3-epimerase
MKTTRRKFIAGSIMATAGLSTGLNVLANATKSETNSGEFAQKMNDEFSISIFSKNLQWIEKYDEMAKVAADMGFDGIDLTVRPNGHVLPENVEKDLPRAMEAVTKAGLKIIMITTSIFDAENPLSEKVLKTASSLGIRHYRMGYGHYEVNKPVEQSLDSIQAKLGLLAKLNEKYSISGEYQNHSGDYGSGIYFGGPIWDLAAALKKVNSPWLGSQYDIYHATVEGANAWPVGLELISPYIRTIDVKDFHWAKKDGKWSSETVPLGEGMVNFNKFFGLIKQYKLSCPISIHYEYPLGGADRGNKVLTMKKGDVISAMTKDIVTLKKLMKESKLV